MDIALIRTFLEVVANGSFVAAAERLFVTQSAVSIRIQKLEAEIGQPLFIRSRAGAEMTPAGREFEQYALSLVKVWEEARQQVAIPAGFSQSLHIAAQYSLWPRLGFRWLDRLRQNAPSVSLRADVGMPDRLVRFLTEGLSQMALLYTPQLRPGLRLEQVVNEELILVASWPNPTMELGDRYAFIDWGPEFLHAHAMHLPEMTNPGLTLALGSLAADYLINRNLAGYLPARAAKGHIDEGRLHLTPDAPTFPYPAWLLWRDDMDAALAETAIGELRAVATNVDIEQGAVIEGLSEISGEGGVQSLTAAPAPSPPHG